MPGNSLNHMSLNSYPYRQVVAVVIEYFEVQYKVRRTKLSLLLQDYSCFTIDHLLEFSLQPEPPKAVNLRGDP